MPTQWYYKAFDQTFGPVLFRELVETVREGVVTEEDPVRPDYLEDWQRADTVVGLFYMARRQAAPSAEEDVPEGPEEERVDAQAVPEESESQGPAASRQEPERPGWLRSLLEASGVRLPAASPRDGRSADPAPASSGEAGWEGETPAVSVDEPGFAEGASEAGGGHAGAEPIGAEGACSRAVWSAAVDEALEAVDARQEKARGRRGAFWRTRVGRVAWALAEGLRSPWLVRQAFRLGMAVVCANLAAYGVESWSAREALRFPSRDSQAAPAIFPLLGACEPWEYSVLLVNLMLTVGVAAYAVAYWLESQADDG